MFNLSLRPALAALGTGTASIAIAALLATPVSAHPTDLPPFIGSTTGSAVPTTGSVDPATIKAPIYDPSMMEKKDVSLCPDYVYFLDCTNINIYNTNIPVAVAVAKQHQSQHQYQHQKQYQKHKYHKHYKHHQYNH